MRRNFGLKLFAGALALGGWAYFRFLAAPSITAQFDQQFNIPIVGSRVEARPFPVDLQYSGRQNGLVVSQIEVTPAEVTISASAGDLERIQRVYVIVAFPSGPTTFDGMVRPTVLKSGLGTTGRISPDLVRVRAVFELAQQ